MSSQDETVPLSTQEVTDTQTSLAWGVHAVTASGAVVGFLTLLAIVAGDFRRALLWMALALLIDTLDGSLARRVGVERVLPEFDGKMLDWVLDWVNFVFLPAYFLFAADLVAPEVRFPSVIAILTSSAYHFGNRKAVTEEGNFLGFPAFWNLVVFYLFLLDLGPRTNFALVVLFCVLHFLPVHFVYPTRMHRLRKPVWIVLLLTAAASLLALLRYPERNPWLLGAVLLPILLFGLISFHLTLRSRGLA